MLKWTKRTLGIFFVGLAVFLFLGLVMYADFIGFLMVYPYIVVKVSGYGLNIYLAQVIGLIIGIGLWVTIFKFFLSWNKKRRYIGFGLIVLIFVSHSLVMYAVNYNTIVHPITGDRKFCIDDKLSGRVKVYEGHSYDEFGDQSIRCNDSQLRRFEINKRYAMDNNQEIDFYQVANGFISQKTGKAIFFYCNDTEARVHFFNMRGHCPWGGELSDVTADIIKQTKENNNYRPIAREISEPQVKPASKINFFAFEKNKEATLLFAFCFLVILIVLMIFFLAGIGIRSLKFCSLCVFSIFPMTFIGILIADLAVWMSHLKVPNFFMAIFGIPIFVLVTLGYYLIVIWISKNTSLERDFCDARYVIKNMFKDK
ncbi:hypothetical protein HN858_02165 [Candidatus Falkowbacteria bacterium]|jgi:hypothetical protein|nr:hypothetical protein [Candidatus Falkowbacteria bacterium]MBT5502811.1 hypothetical protein [Candidatus Falkowbacteria bacterium]MBT6573418.1 hypothetical protein [Candidatus Falkowbacteria bacterium]MBT7348460.1 hypothetical protein [Candidatus Falkowbacteria bacterium]MBT7501196.1 hypothetical protein [Candidatus Falkowbacteria bacterium]